MSLSGSEKVSAPIPGGTRLDKLKEAESDIPLEPSNVSRESEDGQCTPLVEIGMEHSKRDDQLMLEFHRLLAARNCEVIISLGTIGVWNSSFAILHTGAGPNLIKEEIVLAA